MPRSLFVLMFAVGCNGSPLEAGAVDLGGEVDTNPMPSQTPSLPPLPLPLTDPVDRTPGASPHPCADDAASEPSCAGPWCWDAPLAQGNRLYAVWAAAPTDLWAAGAWGTLVHFDGISWTIAPQISFDDLTAISGSGPSDVWAAGGTLLHYDGATWTDVNPNPGEQYTSVWAAAPNDVWLAGGARLQHFDGSGWTEQYPPADGYPSWGVLWGSAGDDVWVAGSSYNPGSGGPLADLSVSQPTVAHWDGHAFTAVPDAPIDVQAIWGTSKTDVWMSNRSASYHFDGAHFTPSGPAVSSLGGNGPTDVWGVDGYTGKLAHFDGGSWSTVDGGTPSALLAVVATGGVLWAVGDSGEIVRGEGGAFVSQIHSPLLREARLFSLWACGASDVWAVGDDRSIAHNDGNGWSVVTGQDYNYDALEDVWGSASNDVWAVGDNDQLRHYDGATWKDVPLLDSGHDYAGVWGSAPNDVWMVGATWQWVNSSYEIATGEISHFDGTSWTLVERTDGALWDVWGSAPDDVWFVGAQTVLHWDGGQFSTVPTGSQAELSGVWGSSRNDVYMVGTPGTILHWDGARLTSQLYEPTTELGSVWGSGPDDVWAVGVAAMQHFDGKSWTTLTPITVDLWKVFGLSAHTVWIPGTGGVLRRASF